MQWVCTYRAWQSKYTALKVYDKTSSNIMTQFVTEHLLMLQVLHHLKPSTHCHHYVTHCSCPSEWCRLSRENSLISGTSCLVKQVASVLRRIIIWADGQVKRLWLMFVCHFFIVHGNPQCGQAGNWVLSVAWQCKGCCIRNCLSSHQHFSCCRSLSPVTDHIGETFYWYAELPWRGQFVFEQNYLHWQGYVSLVREGEL